MDTQKTDKVNELTASLGSLTTFEQLRDLVSRGKIRVEDLAKSIDALLTEKQNLNQQIQQKQQEPSFLGSGDEQKLKKQLDDNLALVESYTTHKENLSIMIEALPMDKESVNAMLKDGRFKLKDLKLQKREINEQMRQVRVQARVKRAEVSSPTSRLLFSRKRRGSDRGLITVLEELDLQPLEAQKRKVEAEIVAMERYIAWLSNLE